MLTIGVDVGGTFTDIYVREVQSGKWLAHKVPSTPPNFLDGFMRGVQEAVGHIENCSLEDVQRIIHGTTVATNTVLTQSGARLGFLLTEGLSDVLYIGVGWRPRMYDLDIDPVEPLFLAPRRRCLGVRERVDVNGNVAIPLDEDSVRELAKTLVEEHDVEVFVVCFLHSYANSDHEKQTKKILNKIYPHIPVTLSSEVLPLRREYRRLVVSGFDAYVKPVVANYIDGMVSRLSDAGINAPLHIMQSSGGVMGVETIVEQPVRTVLSGLAAGVVGAAHVGLTAGFSKCISLDMGGTSTDVALIQDGQPIVSSDGSFEDYPLHIPMVDVRTIGAGGSSIAHLDDVGGIRVGPRSAGANPGPACYCRGGKEPTVTDASFILGYLNPETFAGGIDLDTSKSREAVANYIAKPLGLNVTDAALGIHRIVNSNMSQILRLVSIKRGFDPREVTLIAFGGAGPLHAGRLAEAIGIRQVLIPGAPGVLSAFGLMLAPVQHDAQSSYEIPAAQANLKTISSILKELDSVCSQKMKADEVPPERRSKKYLCEIRYIGQSHQLEVSIAHPLNEQSIANAISEFHDAHMQVYNHANREAETELVTLRTVHHADPDDVSSLNLDLLPVNQQTPKTRYREAQFSKDRGFEQVPVLKRNELPVGYEIDGPAIVEQSDTTTVVYPGHKARVDKTGNLIIDIPQRDHV